MLVLFYIISTTRHSLLHSAPMLIIMVFTFFNAKHIINDGGYLQRVTKQWQDIGFQVKNTMCASKMVRISCV